MKKDKKITALSVVRMGGSLGLNIQIYEYEVIPDSLLDISVEDLTQFLSRINLARIPKKVLLKIITTLDLLPAEQKKFYMHYVDKIMFEINIRKKVAILKKAQKGCFSRVIISKDNSFLVGRVEFPFLPQNSSYRLVG